MEFIVGQPEPEKVVEIIGPFRGDYYRLIVNGCEVPYVELSKNTDPQHEWEKGFEWYLVLDRRFGMFCNEDEIMRWGMVFANAMAIAAGYTYHGPDSKRANPFAKKVVELDSVSED